MRLSPASCLEALNVTRGRMNTAVRRLQNARFVRLVDHPFDERAIVLALDGEGVYAYLSLGAAPACRRLTEAHGLPANDTVQAA